MSAHAPDIPTTATTAVLQWNLLEEPLIRWRSTRERHAAPRTSLPQLLAAMVGNEVRDFPALRPHQRHPWHAFLVQLGAIALHHAEHQQPWQTAADWRMALLALTPDDPDGAPWCLVTPADRPRCCKRRCLAKTPPCGTTCCTPPMRWICWLPPKTTTSRRAAFTMHRQTIGCLRCSVCKRRRDF